MSESLTDYPKVSVLWVNYNSKHIIETAKKSLNALFSLNYPSFELVIVDNGSVDGSAEEIEKILQAMEPSKFIVTFVKVKKNFGWISGVNAGYGARDRKSKYVALTHNDVVTYPNYLRGQVGYMENHSNVGAVQGIVKRLGNSSKIDSSGFMLDEGLNIHTVHESSNFTLTKPIYLSYVEGTIPLYRVEAVTQALKNETDLFVSGAYMYYLEDVFVSLALWSRGYKCILLPTVTGEHQRTATNKQHEKSLDISYYFLRNQIALLCMTNSADKLRFILQNLRRIAVSKGSFAFRQMMLRSLIEGIRNGRQLQKRYGKIDLYKTPMRKASLKSRFRF
ncbi:MAG: glycosyltransferase [Candidatus Bathyarchaeia archaeon]